MQNTKCPLCNSDIIIEDEAYEGDLVNCINCEAELEISSLQPLRLTLLETGVEKDAEAGEDNDEEIAKEPEDQ